MRFSWHEAKRLRNLLAHGYDFADAKRVFEDRTLTFEDDRFPYGQQRFITLGLLDGRPVSLAHTEIGDEIHVISFRKATPRECRLLREIAD